MGGEIHPDAQSLKGRLATSTGWVVAWRLVTRNLGLVSTLVLVRLLQPADFGLVALASALATTVDAFSAFGVQDALMRLPSPSRGSYDSAFWLGVMRGAMTALLMTGLAWPAATFFNEPRLSTVVLALAFGTLVSAFENIGTVDFRRNMQFSKEFSLQVIPRVIGIITTISMAVIWQNYFALIAGIVVTRIARLFQSYIMSPFRPRFQMRDWRPLLGFSLWNWLLTIIAQIRERLDSFIIGRTMATTDVALFSVGQEIGSLPITEMIEPLHRTLFSAFVLLNSGTGETRKLYLGTLEASFLLILPAGIGMSMVADPVVRLMLGSAWLAAIPVVQILAAVSVLSVFRLISDSMYSAAGRMRLSFILVLISVAFRVPLLAYFISRSGLSGAAVALGLSSLIDQVLYIGSTLSRLSIPVWEFAARLWRAVFACGGMVVCLFAAGMAWTPSAGGDPLSVALDLFGRAGFGAVCYALTLAAVWLVAGRPDGAERFVMTRAATLWRRYMQRGTGV